MAVSDESQKEPRFSEIARFPSRKGTELMLAREGKKRNVLIIREFFSDITSAEVHMEERRRWQNQVSLNSHPAFIAPLELIAEEKSLMILCEDPRGFQLPPYVKEFFKGYMTEEGFAIELVYHIVEIFRAVLKESTGAVTVGYIAPEDVFITEEGRVKLIPPWLTRMDREKGHGDTQKLFVESLGGLLFWMLTLHNPEEKNEFLTRCREVNREISESAERLIARAVSSGGDAITTLMAFRQALSEELKKHTPEIPVKDGFMRCFKAEKSTVDYDLSLDSAVKEEEKFQEKVKKPDFGWDYRLIMNTFRNVNKQLDWKKMWPAIILPYLLLLAPFLFVIGFNYTQMFTPGPILLLIAFSFPFYLVIFYAIHIGYRRPVE